MLKISSVAVDRHVVANAGDQCDDDDRNQLKQKYTRCKSGARQTETSATHKISRLGLNHSTSHYSTPVRSANSRRNSPPGILASAPATYRIKF